MPVSNLPPFKCSDQTGGGTTRSDIVAVRVGAGSGYDRFVVQFNGPVPTYRVKQQSSNVVIQDASGQPLTLEGSASLVVTMTPASAFGTYSGPNDFKPRFPVLREARQAGDFEAVTTWGLGISRPACFRAFTLSSPARLVVDVQSP